MLNSDRENGTMTPVPDRGRRGNSGRSGGSGYNNGRRGNVGGYISNKRKTRELGLEIPGPERA